MTRNFGISFEKVTGGSTVGGNQPTRPHISADTRADSNVIEFKSAGALPPDAPVNSLAKEREPFIQGYELGSGLLFLFVVLLPVAIVGGLVIGYLAFVA